MRSPSSSCIHVGLIDKFVSASVDAAPLPISLAYRAGCNNPPPSLCCRCCEIMQADCRRHFRHASQVKVQLTAEPDTGDAMFIPIGNVALRRAPVLTATCALAAKPHERPYRRTFRYQCEAAGGEGRSYVSDRFASLRDEGSLFFFVSAAFAILSPDEYPSTISISAKR